MTLAPQLKHMPVEPLAIALFALATELEAAYPGIASQYGWVQLGDIETLATALNDANQATKPEGLQ